MAGPQPTPQQPSLFEAAPRGPPSFTLPQVPRVGPCPNAFEDGSTSVTFRSASAGSLFQDHTCLSCSCSPDCAQTSPDASTSTLTRTTTTTFFSSSNPLRSLTLSSWTVGPFRIELGAPWGDPRGRSLAHLSGTFSTVGLDQIKASAFQKANPDTDPRRYPARGTSPPPQQQMQGHSNLSAVEAPQKQPPARSSSSTATSSTASNLSNHSSNTLCVGQLLSAPSEGNRSRQGLAYVTPRNEVVKGAATHKRIKPLEAPVRVQIRRRGGVVEQLLCGAFAGVVSRTATAPIDLVRTYLISTHGMEGASTSAIAVLRSILKKEGWVGLFRGNGINCLRVAPNKAIELCMFQMLKRTLCAPGHPLQHIAAPLSGGAAGIAGTIATYPLEVMRTRISVQPERYTSLASTFSKMVHEEGILSMFRGLPISLFGVFPYAAANYFVYDALRNMYRRTTGQEKVPTMATLVFGALAASVSSAVTFPLEVARRRLQLGAIGSSVAPTSGFQVIRQICRKEGWPAIYRGLGTTWLKLIPAAGISFVCYEAARCALRVDDASYAEASASTSTASTSTASMGIASDVTSSGTPLSAGTSALSAHGSWNTGPRSSGIEQETSGSKLLGLSARSNTQPKANRGLATRMILATRLGTSSDDSERRGCDGTTAGRLQNGKVDTEVAGKEDAAVGSRLQGTDPFRPPALQVGRERMHDGVDVNDGRDAKNGWEVAKDYPPLPSPFELGATMVAVRDSLRESEDLHLLKK